jgi:hypothetical protein
MLVIRRMVDRHHSYTGIFLPGEPPRIFPTTDHEHGRILQIYKQDQAYEGVINDFSDDFPVAMAPLRRENQSPATSSPDAAKKKQPRAQHRKTRQ